MALLTALQTENGLLVNQLKRLYSADENQLEIQKSRYVQALQAFEQRFGCFDEEALFSSPGRVEVIGNHTDHNHGLCIAASVNADTIAVAAKTEKPSIEIYSEGHNPISISLSDLGKREAEGGKSSSLARGTAACFQQWGYKIGGFCAYTTSDVPKGSGLSSSAAFENLIGTILNHFYNEGKIDHVSIAKIGRFSENYYYEKPCGLLDQLSSACGGTLYMDFADPEKPWIENLAFDVQKTGCVLCLVDTAERHNGHVEDYASIPAEMKQVAHFFGKDVLREVDSEDFFKSLFQIRKNCPDRAILRAIHYFNENRRVLDFKESIQKGRYDTVFSLIRESGKSSFCYNQNVFSCDGAFRQGLSLALAVCDTFLSGRGAFRLHGGGFGGTILALVPVELYSAFEQIMKNTLGDSCVKKIHIRPVGCTRIV